MLLDFQVSNYRSFRTEAKLSLAASNYDSASLPGNVMSPQLPGISKQKFLRGAAIYGANASGKSNVIRAIFDLQKLVRTSHHSEAGAGLPTDPFLLDSDSRAAPTLYRIRFVASGVRYHYSLAFDSKRVLEESLSAFPKAKEQLWYHRLWDEEEETYSYDSGESGHFAIRKTDIESTKPNSLFLSTATNLLNHPKLGPVYEWFRETLKVVNLGIDSDHMDSGTTLGRYQSNPNQVMGFLRKADLGIAEMRLRTKRMPAQFLQQLPKEIADRSKDSEMVSVDLFHTGSGGERHPLEMNQESSGTQRFFDLIGPWLELIENGMVLFLDELETSLHPLLTRELIRIVMDPDVNTKNAQIIFATHDPLLLDTALLRRDQIWLTEKTREGDSILYALNEYKNPPSKRESLVRGYLSGRYGGIPYIPESLFTAPEPSATAIHE
jgi:AAA15 family ATPase/GTPase